MSDSADELLSSQSGCEYRVVLSGNEEFHSLLAAAARQADRCFKSSPPNRVKHYLTASAAEGDGAGAETDAGAGPGSGTGDMCCVSETVLLAPEQLEHVEHDGTAAQLGLQCWRCGLTHFVFGQ